MQTYTGYMYFRCGHSYDRDWTHYKTVALWVDTKRMAVLVTWVVTQQLAMADAAQAESCHSQEHHIQWIQRQKLQHWWWKRLNHTRNFTLPQLCVLLLQFRSVGGIIHKVFLLRHEGQFYILCLHGNSLYICLSVNINLSICMSAENLFSFIPSMYLKITQHSVYDWPRKTADSDHILQCIVCYFSEPILHARLYYFTIHRSSLFSVCQTQYI